MKKTIVYGASDDPVEIENTEYAEDEIWCFDKDVRLTFSDGTIALVHYSKPHKAIWSITIEKRGTAEMTLEVCNDEDAEIYSDVLLIDADVVSHENIPEGENK